MKIKRLSNAALLPLVISITLIVATLTFPAHTDSFAQGPPSPSAQPSNVVITNTPTRTSPPVTPPTSTSTGQPTVTTTEGPTETTTPTGTLAPTATDRPLFPITPITTPTVSQTVTIAPIAPLPTAPTSPTRTATTVPTVQAQPTATSTSVVTSTSTPTLAPTATLSPTASPTPTTTPTPGVPQVVIVSPQPGAEITAGEPLTVEAKISDPAGIERVELWVDGKMVGVQSPALKGQTAMTALFSWTPLSPGSHTVGIRAINVFGLENDLVVVVVNASGAEPRVTILSPMDGEQLPVGLQIMIQALAEDPTGVERGELWVNGKLVAEWTRTEAESRDSIKAGFFFGSESKSGQTNPPESMAPIKAGFIQLPQVAMSFPWTPSAAGEYTLEVRTFNSSTEQHRATDSVVVVAEGAEATPSMMSITGGAFAPWWMPGLLLLVLLVAFRIIQSRNL